MNKGIVTTIAAFLLIGVILWMNRSVPQSLQPEPLPTQAPTPIIEPSPTIASPEAVRTDIIQFDPLSIPINEDEDPLTATCEHSAIVNHDSVYSCTPVDDESIDPCFPIDISSLICDPDPSTNAVKSYKAFVTSSNPLPTGNPEENEPVALFVELDTDDQLTCSRLEPTMIIDEKPITYGCNVDNTWITGELETSDDIMTANVVTKVSLTSDAVSSTKTNILKVWIY